MTKVISGFPGIGKSYVFESITDLKILDSDSSKFPRKATQFPSNYIKHIKDNIGKADIILVSSHSVVRDALVMSRIDFTLVYPEKSLKREYLERFKQRGSSQVFIDNVDKFWDEWIDACDRQRFCTKVVLSKGMYLGHVLGVI